MQAQCQVLDGSVQSMPMLIGAVEVKVKLTFCEVMNYVSLSGSPMDKFESGQCQENPSCVAAVKFGGVGITGKKSVSQALSSNISIWPQKHSYV